MPNYSYIAKSFDGETSSGVLNAADEHELSQMIKNQGLILIRADLEEKTKKSLFSFSLPFKRVSSTQRIILTKNLGIMFSTGLSLVKSFDILSAQTKNKRMKSILLDIKNRISKGENFSDALSKYPNIFSELYCNMIKVGEESGTLDEIFQILSLQITKEHELKSKITNAMIYPSIIVAAMIVIGIVVVTFVLPALNVFFTSLNVPIPFYTKILLFSGNFLLERWYVVLLAILLIVLFGFLIIRTKKGKQAVDDIFLKTPIISSIIKKSHSASFVRSLSSLTGSGVSLVRSLEIISKTLGNHYFKEAITEASKKIKKGEKLSASLKAHQNIFPFGVVEMIEVGEETGKTSLILKKLADFYEQEAVVAIEKLTIIIEPALIIILGLAVAFFAFSIIEPMYSSLSAINQ